MKSIISFFRNWRGTGPTPVFIATSGGVEQVTPPLPSVAPQIEQCWAAWEQMLAVENVVDDATQTIKGLGIEKEWSSHLREQRAVICILTSYSGPTGVCTPSFDYPRPAELEHGMQRYFCDWQRDRQPTVETRDIVIYRIDLGPCKVDPGTAYRAQILGTQSVVIQQIKKEMVARYLRR